jgi:hypothetical protein
MLYYLEVPAYMFRGSPAKTHRCRVKKKDHLKENKKVVQAGIPEPGYRDYAVTMIFA